MNRYSRGSCKVCILFKVELETQRISQSMLMIGMGWIEFGFIFACLLLSVIFFALASVARRSSRILRKTNLVTLDKFQLQPKYLYDLRSRRMFMQNKNKNISLINPEYFKVKKNVDSFLDEMDLFKTMEECVFCIFKGRSTTTLFE